MTASTISSLMPSRSISLTIGASSSIERRWAERGEGGGVVSIFIASGDGARRLKEPADREGVLASSLCERFIFLLGCASGEAGATEALEDDEALLIEAR